MADFEWSSLMNLEMKLSHHPVQWGVGLSNVGS